MRILFFHMHFKTPYEGGAIRSYLVAEFLTKHGYDVEVITIHNEKVYKKTNVDNITIHYLPITYQNSFSFIKRINAFLDYNRHAFKLATTLPKPNLVYAISTPLTVGLLSMKFKKKIGVDYIFEV